jgi:WD40 repeat protein
MLHRVPMIELLKYGIFILHSIGLLLQTYLNHSSGVVALEWLDKDTLASAGWSDQTIKIRSSNTSQTKRIINSFAA